MEPVEIGDYTEFEEEILEVLHEFGFSDREIVDSSLGGYPPRPAVRDEDEIYPEEYEKFEEEAPENHVRAAIRDTALEGRDPWEYPDELSQYSTLLKFISRGPSSTRSDNWPNLFSRISSAIGYYGYGLQARDLDGNELTWGDLGRDTHPEAYYIELLDGDPNDNPQVLSKRAYRPPPTEYGAFHVPATFCAVNRTVLDPIGLEFKKFNSLSDMGIYVARKQSKWEELQAEYGPRLTLFGNDLLAADSIANVALRGYHKHKYLLAETTNHEEVFGVPEPEDTFKVEQIPSVREYIQEPK